MNLTKQTLFTRTTLLLLLFLLALPAQADSVQDLINKANGFANQNNYAQAIPLYEQATQKEPGNTQLKNNLSVLYVNHGLALQGDKKYDQANTLFDKALVLDPNDPHAKSGKAGSHYHQAMDLRESQTPPDYATIHQHLDQAITLDPSQVAFKQAKASVLQQQAVGLAETEQYAEAEPLLQEALTLQPESATIKQSLANLYLGQAYQARQNNDEATMNAMAEKALTTSDSPQVKQNYDRLMAPPEAASATPQHSFLSLKEASMGKKKVKKRPDSIQDMLLDIEVQLGIERDASQTLMQRLLNAEQQVHGSEPQTGPMAKRVEDLYATLLGSTVTATTEARTPAASVQKDNRHYIQEIFEVTDGKVVRWGNFPLRVYIDDPEDEKKDDDGDTAMALYQSSFKEAVVNALDVWKEATQGFTSYIIVQNPGAADVQFLWGDDYKDAFADPENTPDFYKTYTPPKRTKLMRVLQVASMFTPGYFSLAPQAANAALQYRQYQKVKVLKEESEVTLGLNPVKELPSEEANILIQNMAAKEFGHVLGLKAASPEPGDLMHPHIDSKAIQTPSARDLATLQQLYSRPANIILNIQ